MCLAVPGKLLEILGNDPLTRNGKIAFAGIVKQASLSFLPEAEVGDYVLVHAGFAITVLNEAEAKRSLEELNRVDAVKKSP
jgi:hydrogenase expression/formation protein HypC